jgi:hypothetical protein
MALIYGTQVELSISDAISVSDTVALSDQQKISQTSQDSTITVGKSTLAGDDVKSVAQSFIANSRRIDKINLWVGKNGSPTDSLRCRIFTDNSNSPGTIISGATTTISGSDISDTAEEETFDFSETFDLVYGEKYWIIIDRTGSASDSNYYEIGYDASDAYSNGLLSRSDDGSTWTNDVNDYDLYFELYAGSVSGKITEFNNTGNEQAVDVLNTLTTQYKNESRPTMKQMEITAIFNNIFDYEYLYGSSTNPVEDYHRISGIDKTGNRPNRSVLIKMTADFDDDGSNEHVNVLMNNAWFTVEEASLTADGHVEAKMTCKCLTSDFIAEDDI